MKHILGPWRQRSRLFPIGLVVLFGAGACPLARAGSVDFKQAANRNPVPGNVIWITSILQLNNSRYFEGLSTLQRLVLLDIPAAPGDNPNRHSLNFGHEAAKSGFHAYDFLTSWEQARAASIYYSGSDLFDPLNPDGENLSSTATGAIIRQLRGGTNRFAATAPNGLGIVENDDVQARANAYALKFGERVIRLYGDAPILSAELRFNGYSGTTDKFAEYTLVWESSSTNLLIEMAGHLALGGAADNPLGYGPGRGSASINGGPYHFKLATLDGASLGSQDNQIKGADILVPPPVVALDSSLQNICAGSAPATFTATVIADGTAPFSYAWTGPDGFTSNAATISVSVAGIYSVVVTDAGGLTSRAVSSVLTVSPRPIVTITSGQITCSKPEVDLVAESSASGLSFHWSGPGIVSGGEQRIVTVNQRGEYTLVVVDSNGCSTTVSAVVDENKRPPEATAEGGTLACATPQINLRASSATAGALFHWNGPGLATGADTATPTVNLAGTYQVTITDPENGCSATATAIVNEDKTLPVVTASGGVLTCLHPELRLSSSSSPPGTRFAWSGPGIVSGADTASPLVNKPGQYIVTAQDPANGCSATAVVTVSENLTAPVVNVTGATLTCAKRETPLHASCATAAATFRWNGPGIVSGAETDSPLVNSAGVYSVTATDPANGCATTAFLTVDENKQALDATAEGGALTCATPQISLRASSATAGALFHWNGPGLVTGADTATPTVNLAGTYLVTVTDPLNGCSAIATAIVNENKTLPMVNASGGVLTCLHPELRLSSSSSAPGTRFTWSGPGIVSGADTASPLVNKPGQYMVTAQDPVNGCSATAAVTVGENLTVPLVNVTGATLSCAKREMPLHASCATAAATFRWSGPGIVSGAETDSPLVKSAGVYAVTATDPANGCATTAFVTVTEDRQPPVLSVSGATLTCAEPMATLRALSSSPDSTFVWTGPGIVSGNDTATPSVNQPGDYSVVVTDQRNGCSATASAVVSEDKTGLTVTATGGMLTCAHPELVLRAMSDSTNLAFLWLGPGIVEGADTASPTVNKPGDYTVTARNPLNECSTILHVLVTENKSAPVIATMGGTLTCAQPQLILNASSPTVGATFSWTGPGLVSGAGSSQPTVDAPGTYVVTVTDPTTGCSSTGTAVVLENKTPPPITAEGGALTCAQPVLTLRASSSITHGTFLWTGPGILAGGDSASPTVSEPGVYTVIVTDPVNGCSASTSATVTQDTAVPVVITHGAVLTCSQTQAVISATATKPGMTCSWSGPGIVSGADSPDCVVNARGLYSVTVTDPAMGCSTTASVSVTEEKNPPVAVITAPNSVEPYSTNLLRATCSAGTLTWTASGSGWSICGSADTNQATFSAGSAGSSGTFTLELKSPGGCIATYQVTVSARAADGAALVSMSQGFYGNSGGTLNGIKSPDLIRRLLTNSQSSGPLPLVLGKPGVRSLTIPLESAQWITTRLPAGGAASALPNFKDQILKANNGQTSPPLPVSNGKFSNILLGQTVTLSLNSRLSPSLLAFPLSNTFVTQKALPGPDNVVGTADDIRSEEMATFTIPTTVLTALNRLELETTVTGLLELANRGLAGMGLGGATLKDVNAAVDAINRGFDKGRLPVNKPVIVAGDQIAGPGNDVPVLEIARGASGTLLVRWPVAHSNYVLQVSSSMTPPDWLEVTTPAVVVENICVVTNTMVNAMQFFRLKKP